MIEVLLSYTPEFVGGFSLNLLMTICTMVVGTLVGMGLGALRQWPRFGLGRLAGGLTAICRNSPAVVLLFYVNTLLPNEFTLFGALITIPLWVKAIIALSFSVIAFGSDQVLVFFNNSGSRAAARRTWMTSWGSYFVLLLMASSTATLMGVDEIVSRASDLILIHGGTDIVFAAYAYVALWFLVAGLIFTFVFRLIARLFGREG